MLLSSERVPAEHVAGTFQLVEIALESRQNTVENGARGPAFRGVRGTDRTRLAEQEDLVVAYAENLPGNVLGLITEQCRRQYRNLVRGHLLDLFHTLFLRFGIDRNGADQTAPGERRDAVGGDAI